MILLPLYWGANNTLRGSFSSTAYCIISYIDFVNFIVHKLCIDHCHKLDPSNVSMATTIDILTNPSVILNIMFWFFLISEVKQGKSLSQIYQPNGQL